MFVPLINQSFKTYLMSTKQIQGKLWSVAPHYWSQHFEPYFLPMYKKVLAQLKLTEETLLLDAGCGSGLFSSMAISTGAQVIGIDAAPGLLEVARQRNPDNNFMEEDLEALPFADNSFDVVTGFNSFQYAGDFEKALLESKRVLKKKGRLVIGIWDKPEMSEATQILKAIGSFLPPPPPGTPGPFALSFDGALEALVTQAGMNPGKIEQVDCPWEYPDERTLLRALLSPAPSIRVIQHAGEGVVRDAILKALAPFKTASGGYHFRNKARYMIVKT